jgi:hypothetical protein
MSDETFMHATGESHDCVVPTKASNKDRQGSAEGLEGRRSIEESTGEVNPSRTQSREIGSRGLHGVREAAKKDKELRFTALLHHVTEGLLRDSFYALQRQAAPGVDRVTWQQYEQGLEARIKDLHGRVHRGAYRAQPSRRIYIPKPDGRQRPLGIAAVEDKVVQQAVVTVLNAIYEEDFIGFSYGFRPEKSAQGPPLVSGGIGRADGGDRVEEGELDPGCGCPRLFRQSRPWASAGVYPETRGRSKGTAADPEMAESRSVGGWGVVGDEGGDSARGGDLAAFSEHLPALRTRPMGGVVAQAIRDWGHGNRPLRG